MAEQCCPVSPQGLGCPEDGFRQGKRTYLEKHISLDSALQIVWSQTTGVLLRLFGYMLARFYVCGSADHTSD